MVPAGVRRRSTDLVLGCTYGIVWLNERMINWQFMTVCQYVEAKCIGASLDCALETGMCYLI